MTKFNIVLAALASLALASQASALTYSCSVNPAARLGVNSDGLLTVNVNGDKVAHICSVGQTVGAVTPEACSAWYGLLLTLRSLGKTGVIYFDSTNSSNQGNTICQQLPSPAWSVRIPYYIEGV